MAIASAPSTTSPIRQAIATCRSAITATAIFSFVGNVLLFTSPLYMLQVYDRVLSSRSHSTLVMLTLVVAFLYIISAVMEAIRSRVLVRAGAKLDTVLAGRAFAGVMEATLKAPGSGAGQVLRDMDTLREFATGPALLVFCDAPMAPLFVILAFVLHPIIGVVTLLGAIIIFSLAYANELITRRGIKQAGMMSMSANAFADSSLRNSEVLHAMGMLPAIAKRWLLRHEAALGMSGASADKAGLLLAVSKFVRMFLQSAILGIGAWLCIEDQVTAGAIIAGSILMGRALAPVEMLVGHWKGFIAARSAYGRLDRLLTDFGHTEEKMPLPRPEGAVSLERVYVVPPAGRTPVLKNLSFSLEPGEVLGVVGPSAAGKSSLARALIGVWPVASGNLRLDGAELSQLDRAQIGPALGYLPQDVELFDGTVAENIARFGEIDADKVVEACRQAGVHEMILGLSEGYDTRIGEGGSKLSGGQRQRIGLARALYGDPAFIVLDEPNSNLDGAGEQALVEAVLALKERKATCVVITHRVSILGSVDKVMLINNGEIELFGPRDEVLQRLSRPHVVASHGQAKTPAKAVTEQETVRSQALSQR